MMPLMGPASPGVACSHIPASAASAGGETVPADAMEGRARKVHTKVATDMGSVSRGE